MSAQLLDLGFYQSAQCREKILDAAFQLYAQAECGPAPRGVSLSEVAARAELLAEPGDWKRWVE